MSTDVKIIILEKEVKSLRHQAHQYFDMLWKLGYVERNKAYEYMMIGLNRTPRSCHMKNMRTRKQFTDVIEWSVMLLNDLRRIDLDFGCEAPHPYFEIEK